MAFRSSRRRGRFGPLKTFLWLCVSAIPLVGSRVRKAGGRGHTDGVTSGGMEVEAKAEEREPEKGDEQRPEDGKPGDERPPEPEVKTEHALPDADTCRAVLEKMTLIRRFEERAGEMYAKAKIGGFLHLCIGEEAAIVGAVEAMRDRDYLISTYREHGQALARGTHANAVMAELFGREDGCSRGRGGSMHLFDYGRRFVGGYGIVGGNLPLAVGLGLASDYEGTEDATLCMMGDGASNQGTFGESMNLAALWKLPVVFMVINNQFGMGTALDRHSAVTDLSKKAEGFGVPGSRCDGMDVLEVHASVSEALRKAREERRPQLVEAVTYRFRGHSMADPEEYREKEEVEEWRKRDPLTSFGKRLVDEGVMAQQDIEEVEEAAVRTIDEAVEAADASPFPDLDSLYDDIYVYGDQVKGWYAVDERSPHPHRGEEERESGVLAHDLAEAGAAYAGVGDAEERSRRQPGGGEAGAEEGEGEAGTEEGEGEQSGDERDEEGGGG
jgi:pyruvate dehydrogenase E1 component alpha subunit